MDIVAAAKASGIAVVHTLLPAFVIHRIAPLRALAAFLIKTVRMTGEIMLLLVAAALSVAMAFTEIPAAMTSIIPVMSGDPVMVILITDAMLVVSCSNGHRTGDLNFYSHPAAHQDRRLAMVPVHFGIVVIFSLATGTITSPVGAGRLVGVDCVKVETPVHALAPFWLLRLAGLMLITDLPWLTM